MFKLALSTWKRKPGSGLRPDDPLALARRARQNALTANRQRDTIALREAAEVGWLAASSTADVVAARLGHRTPKGASGRRAVLVDLEKQARLRTGVLVGPFEAARTILHGECFHGNVCSVEGVQYVIENVEKMAHTALNASGKKGRRG